MVKVLSFETVSKARRANTSEYVFLVTPEELGLTAEDCGVNEGEKVGLKYRPITSSELGQVLLNIKDVKPPHYIPARDEGIIQACSTEPKLPHGVGASRIMQNWMPGTVANYAANIQKTSGYDDHEVITAEEAVDELGNSGTATKRTTGS